jgi:hypothetical protein
MLRFSVIFGLPGELLPSVILGLDPRIHVKKIFFPWIPGQAGDDRESSVFFP